MTTLSQISHAIGVTPSDTALLPQPSNWLAFTNSGTQTLAIDTPGGEKNVSIVLPSGMWQISATKVYSTGTTVTNIVAFWGP